ncbi:hypothetical protein [Saccharomonospora sp. NB11]|jgi:hypothetical protein|uniref:hypothetical protein n=1 Tax=Saccharomonospora sp. NB11 TaxID=1642298 RepID=UPI0018D1938B|nr:hypothetical protein [Saccharomonospora sp. NB11]
MLTRSAAVLWRRAYRRVVRSAFDTVPFYRERWALDGRTEPTLVPGRTGSVDGATEPEVLRRTVVDLVPLSGGSTRLDPTRGLGHVLPRARDLRTGALVVVVDDAASAPPSDLPRGVRGCVVNPDLLGDADSAVSVEVTNALHRGSQVVAVGGDKELARLASALPESLARRLDRLPRRTLSELDTGPYGVLHDPLLGYLGALGECGRWHLDFRHVYARRTKGGLAVTLLTQRSPVLVDVLVAGGVHAAVETCPRHGTPVVSL